MKSAHYALAMSAGMAALAGATGHMRVPNYEAAQSVKSGKNRPKKDRTAIKAARKQARRNKRK